MDRSARVFKTEEVNRQTYQTHEQATRAVIDYIERFYNPVRLHTSVGFVSPNEFDGKLYPEINTDSLSTFYGEFQFKDR